MTLNNVVVHAGLTPPGPSATDDIPSARTHALLRNPQVHALKENSDNTQEDDDCGDLNDDCLGCLQIENCLYLKFNTSETKCLKLPGGIEDYKPENGEKVEFFTGEKRECPTSTKAVTPIRISPKFNTSLVNDNANTNTTTASTSTTAKTTTKTTSDTTISSTTTTSVTTTSITTKSSTSTTKPSPSTTSTMTTTQTPSTTSPVPSTTSKTTPIPQPDPRGGSHFDGWSFFGGILLTVGIAAIAFISFKYYKVRAGQHNSGANYNRF